MFRSVRVSCAMLCLAAVTAGAQETTSGFWRRLGEPYRVPALPATRYEDTARLKTLLRGGQIYLSLDDAIALAIENNLDVAVQRYVPVFAAADALRTASGATPRGLQLTVREAPAGIVPGSAFTGNVDTTSNQSDVNLALGQVPGIGGASFSAGPKVPAFDPSLVGQISSGHRTTPQANPLTYGTSSLIAGSRLYNTTFQQGFTSGAQLNVFFNNARQNLNSGRLDYNPSTYSSMGLTFSQPLLQGFGFALNRRHIRIARNNQNIADLTFQQQLVATVSGVIRLYWDLVSARQDSEVRREALKEAETLLENNRTQVEVGTLAAIEETRAQAEVARTRQALTNSESLVLQQEIILKNYLTRGGTEDAEIRAARLNPTDRIRVPDTDPSDPVDTLVEQAFRSRPDYAQALLQLDSSRISLEGSRNALLPQLDLVGTMQNNALAGELNLLPPPGAAIDYTRLADPQFLGGYGSVLSQLFRRRYPDYAVYLQLNIPLSNRQARADMMRDAAQMNQSAVRLEQLKHQVRTEVEVSLIALRRARASYDAARQTRILQEQALEAEQEKYNVGATTSFFLIQYQRDLAEARSGEVTAQSIYAKALNSFERATGQILTRHNIDQADAYKGEMRRVSTPPPVP